MSLADQLADQLGHVRIQQEQLGTLAHHLLAAIDIAHSIESDSSTATRPGLPPVPVDEVAVDTPDPEPARAKGSKYDLAEVATVAREAIGLGISPKKHVHDKLPACPTEAMAQTLIAQARKAGHDIPRLKARPPVSQRSSARQAGEEQVPGKHFQCSVAACGHSTATVREMNRHTRSSHNRDAYVHERIPT